MNRLFLLLVIFFITSISGCAVKMSQPPSSFSVEITETHNLPASEVELIFLEVFSETYKVKPFVKENYNGNPYYAGTAEVNSTTIKYSAMNADFGHHFYLRNGRVMRQDISEEQNGDGKGEAAYCMLCNDKGFTAYIEDFQYRLSQNLKKRFSSISSQ